MGNTLPVLPEYSECSGECCTAFELGQESPESLLGRTPRQTGAAHGYEVSHMLVYLGFLSKPPRGCGVFDLTLTTIGALAAGGLAGLLVYHW